MASQRNLVNANNPHPFRDAGCSPEAVDLLAAACAVLGAIDHDVALAGLGGRRQWIAFGGGPLVAGATAARSNDFNLTRTRGFGS